MHTVEPVVRLRLCDAEFILEHAEVHALIAKLQRAVDDPHQLGAGIKASAPNPDPRGRIQELIRECSPAISAPAAVPASNFSVSLVDGVIQIKATGSSNRISVPLDLSLEFIAALRSQTQAGEFLAVSVGWHPSIWVARAPGAGTTFGVHLRYDDNASVLRLDAAEAQTLLEYMQSIVDLTPIRGLGSSVRCADHVLYLPTPRGVIRCAPTQTAMLRKILTCIADNATEPRSDRTDGLVIVYPVPNHPNHVGITCGEGHIEFHVDDSLTLLQIIDSSASSLPVVVLDTLTVGGRGPGRAVFSSQGDRVFEVEPQWLVEVALLYKKSPPMETKISTSHGPIVCYRDRIYVLVEKRIYMLQGDAFAALLRYGARHE